MIVVFWLILAAGLLLAARALWPSRAQRAYGYPHHTRNGHHR